MKNRKHYLCASWSKIFANVDRCVHTQKSYCIRTLTAWGAERVHRVTQRTQYTSPVRMWRDVSRTHVLKPKAFTCRLVQRHFESRKRAFESSQCKTWSVLHRSDYASTCLYRFLPNKILQLNNLVLIFYSLETCHSSSFIQPCQIMYILHYNTCVYIIYKINL